MQRLQKNPNPKAGFERVIFHRRPGPKRYAIDSVLNRSGFTVRILPLSFKGGLRIKYLAAKLLQLSLYVMR